MAAKVGVRCAMALGLAASSCGRTDLTLWSDGDDAGSKSRIVRCAGLAWAANSAQELVLIDLEQQRAELFGMLPVGTWGLATEPRTGELWIVQATDADPSIWRHDPFTERSDERASWTTYDNADRAAMDESGRLWAMFAPSGEIRIFDPATDGTVSASVGAIPSGGDIVVREDRVYVTWWPNNLLELARTDSVLGPRSSSTLPIDDEEQVSGTVAEDDLLWVATREGEIVAVERDNPTHAIERFTITFAVHDLAPVYGPTNGCPEV